jgi:hypothetical protein
VFSSSQAVALSWPWLHFLQSLGDPSSQQAAPTMLPVSVADPSFQLETVPPPTILTDPSMVTAFCYLVPFIICVSKFPVLNSLY